MEVKPERGSVLVTARDLAPVAEEPYMMPLDEVRASVTLYYSRSSEKPDEYWNAMAKSVEYELKRFVGNGHAIQSAIASMQLPPDGSLSARLEAAYRVALPQRDEHRPDVGRAGGGVRHERGR